MTNVPLYAWHGRYVAHMKKKTKSHKFIYECILLFVKQKFRSIVVIKIELGLENQDMFLRTKKSGFLMEEKLDLFLGNRKFSFFMKEKSNLFFLNVQKKYEKYFLRRGFHSWNKFVLHALNKTNALNTTIHDLFFYSKICYVKKNQICI